MENKTAEDERDILHVASSMAGSKQAERDDIEAAGIIVMELYFGGDNPERGLTLLRRAIIGMARGESTSPGIRSLIGSMLRSGRVRLVLHRGKRGRTSTAGRDEMIAMLVGVELEYATGKREDVYLEAAKRYKLTPRRIQQIVSRYKAKSNTE